MTLDQNGLTWVIGFKIPYKKPWADLKSAKSNLT